MKWFMLLTVVPLFLYSCSQDKAPVPVEGSQSCTDTTATDTITFAEQITSILQTNCTNPSFGNCHQSGAPHGNFTSYEGLLPYINGGQVYDRVVVFKNMPLPSSEGPTNLSPCDIAIIKKWIEDGASNN